MAEFIVKCDYSKKYKRKFFNDKGSKEYLGFIVLNPENIPDEFLYFSKNKRERLCWIWILSDLLKEMKIDFEDPLEVIREYKLIINLGGQKVAKFNTNNNNWMVLKTKDYFENTVKKIGFWDSENYFYEAKSEQNQPTKKQNNNPTQPENKNKTEWGKIALFCLPIVIFATLLLLIIKRVKTKNN